MGEGGRVINIGSTNARTHALWRWWPVRDEQSGTGGPDQGVGAGSRAEGITINNVQPGPVDTDMNPANSDFAESLIGLMAVGRYGHVEEIASFVAYLAPDRKRGISPVPA